MGKIRNGNDYYGDYLSYASGKLEGGLIYYFIDSELLKEYDSKNACAVPPVNEVINLIYFPYLVRGNLDLLATTMDNDRFPLNDNITSPNIKLLRIESTSDIFNKSIGNFKCYKPQRQGGANFHWSNEGKLWQYPYTKLALIDGISTDIEIIPHLCKNSTNDVMVSQCINNFGLYNLFVLGYKNGDQLTAGNIQNTPKTLPIVNSVYSEFMANNQAQIQSNKDRLKGMGILNTVGSFANMGMGLVSNGMTGNVMGVAGTMVNTGTSVAGTVMDYQYSIKQIIAQNRDMQNSGDNITDVGSDVIFNKHNGNGYLNLYRFRYNDQIMEMLGTYFHMYGYAQNKLMTPNIRNRYYYNYIKTLDANIYTTSMSKEEQEELKNIYNNGVTIWHMDRDGVICGDYSKDNREI